MKYAYLGPVEDFHDCWRWLGPGSFGFSLNKPALGYEEYYTFVMDFVPLCCGLERAWVDTSQNDPTSHVRRLSLCGACRSEVRRGDFMAPVLLTRSMVSALESWSKVLTQARSHNFTEARANLLKWLDHDFPLQAELIVDELIEELDLRFNELMGDTVALHAGKLTGNPPF